MKIGIDCRTILNPEAGERAGLGHYTYFLVKSLLDFDKKNKYVLFFDSRYKKTKQFSKNKNVEIKFFPFYQYKKYLPVSYSHLLINALLMKENLDVYHSPSGIIPLFYTRPSVITVHDLALYKHPKLFPPKYISKQVMAIKVLFPKSLMNANKIIAVSKNTKKDIIEEFAISEEKIDVIYEGISMNNDDLSGDKEYLKIKSKYGLSDKYLFYLGTIEPKKNILGLINAYRNLKMEYQSPLADFQLIIAGSAGYGAKKVFENIAESNAAILGRPTGRSGKERRKGYDTRTKKRIKIEGERRAMKERRINTPIKHIGYVPKEEKFVLLKNASAFVYPCLYDGFCSSVLEAMSVKTPVIASRVGSISELTSNHSALLIDPYKESNIADAILRVVTDDGLRDSLVAKGFNNVKYFNWKTCAEKTLTLYKEINGNK